MKAFRLPFAHLPTAIPGKRTLYRLISAYTCLALLSFNIAYASGFLPACPGCAKMEKHEHDGHNSSKTTLSSDPLTPLIGHEHHQSHQTPLDSDKSASSTRTPCLSCDGNCCNDFYHGYMAAITLDIHTPITAFPSKQSYATTRIKLSSFIPLPVHPPPIPLLFN